MIKIKRVMYITYVNGFIIIYTYTLYQYENVKNRHAVQRNARGMFVIVAESESLDSRRFNRIILDRLIDRHMELVGIKCNYIGINCCILYMRRTVAVYGGKKNDVSYDQVVLIDCKNTCINSEWFFFLLYSVVKKKSLSGRDSGTIIYRYVPV